MKRILLLTAVIVWLAGTAAAEDLNPPPWDESSAWPQTFQHWNFPNQLTGAPENSEPPQDMPPLDSGSNYGEGRMPYIVWPQGQMDGVDGAGNTVPVFVETTVQTVDYWPPGSSPSDPGTPVPTVHIGVDQPGVVVPVKIWIPNSPDPNRYKTIFWQMTSDKSATPQANPPTTDPAGTSSPSANPQTAHGGGTWYTYSGLNQITPNPDGEWLTFGLVDSTNIEEIVVKTICSPEPATMGLMAIGTLATLALRRRRR